MPPLRRVLPALAALAALPGCGVAFGDEGEPPPQPVTKRQLATMVLPQEELGPEARGLTVSARSGPRGNREEAEGTVDPEDDGAELRDAGRIDGYSLVYAAASADRASPDIGTSVELFRTEEEASRYLHDQADDFEFFRGRRIAPGVRLAASERFDVGGIGEEARGLTATVRAGKLRIHGTLVAFRRGRIVAAATIGRFDEKDVAERTKEVAAALDRRIEAVLDGSLVAEPVALERPRRGDPKRLTLGAAELPTLELELAHEGRPRARTTRVYLREFDVTGGRLGGSRPFYLRTLAQTFPDRATAELHLDLLRSRAGSRDVAREFLEAWLEPSGFVPKRVEVAPMRWPGADTSGFRFSFDAPNGRVTGAYLTVTKGRATTSVMFAGHAADVAPDDLALVLGPLRARLSDSG